MTESDIFQETIVTPRYAFVPLPDLELVERPGWMQIITPSFATGGFNEISFAALSATEADAAIDAAIAGYRDRGIRFRWAVPPGSSPDDLGARLAARGLARNEVWAMSRTLDATILDEAAGRLPPPQHQFDDHAMTHDQALPLEDSTFDDATVHDGDDLGESTLGDSTVHDGANHVDDARPRRVTVEEVDAQIVDLYTATMAEGWSVAPEPLALAHRIMLEMRDRRHRMFLARVDGEPAATASYVAFERSAYLLGGVTLPRFRRCGCYSALVDARLLDAYQRGLRLATSHARAGTSGPLLEKRGFRTIAKFESYLG